jgi:hypothetical protein
MNRPEKRRLTKIIHADMNRVMLGATPGKGLVFAQVQGVGDKSPVVLQWDDGERLSRRDRWRIAWQVVRLVLGR